MQRLFLKFVGEDARKAALKMEVVFLLISCLALGILLVRHGRELNGWAFACFCMIPVWTVGLTYTMHKYASQFHPKPAILHWDPERD